MTQHPKLLTLTALCLLSASASAQQFKNIPGAIPGPARWSEGVEAVDVDNDGDIDILFADGDGFTSAGTKRANVLLINQLIETGFPTFTDESSTRLGGVSNGKGVTTGDVDGDGWVDVLFANAFNTDTPFLYINRGAAEPGVFDLESSTRGLTQNLSSGSAQFGDLDDDGDLDIIINHAYLGSPTGRPKLYFNDGTGNFTQDAVAMNAPQKSAQMDVQFVDIDNDWDLDFFGVCRANNSGGKHYMMLNDGNGNFTDISASMPTTSSNVYEAEVGDLDGDDDVDAFFVSLSGFGEGAWRNDLIPSTTLGFTSMGGLAGNADDNEVALFDYDLDGDYDMFIASLSGGTEALWRNDGAFSFTNQNADIQSINDSSLDMTIADINNDGRYDLITANGESNAAQWANKIYRNDGGVDTLAPVLVALDAPASATPGDDIKVRAKIRDQVMDDGVNYVSAKGSYVVNTAVNDVLVDIGAGGFSPAVINITVGQHVVFTNTSGANQSVTSTTTPYDYDSGTLTNGQSWEQIYVVDGTYDLESTPSGLTATVNVTGTADMAAATYSGGSIYRFLMPDTASGSGIEVVYELQFTDWAGNQTVTNNLLVNTLDCTPSSYCTAGTSANGCVATLGSTGTPSVSAGSGFTVSASGVEGSKDGLFFYGFNGQQANTWGSGTSFQCVVPPVMRAGLQVGTGTSGACDGAFAQDFNTYWATANPSKVPAVGQEVSLQLWYRDPLNTSNQTTSLSDALKFRVCP